MTRKRMCGFAFILSALFFVSLFSQTTSLDNSASALQKDKVKKRPIKIGKHIESYMDIHKVEPTPFNIITPIRNTVPTEGFGASFLRKDDISPAIGKHIEAKKDVLEFNKPAFIYHANIFGVSDCAATSSELKIPALSYDPDAKINLSPSSEPPHIYDGRALGDILMTIDLAAIGVPVAGFAGAGLTWDGTYLYYENQFDHTMYVIDPTGPSVVTSWSTGLVHPWGVGSETNMWVTDAVGVPGLTEEFTFAGAPTGNSFNALVGGATWMGDASEWWAAGEIWIVAVGGSNKIYKFSVPGGALLDSLSDPTWTTISQRALTYDPYNHTFWIGGWNDNIVWEIDANTGAVLRQFLFADIAGLAYDWQSALHPAPVLWLATNAATDYIYMIDPDNPPPVAVNVGTQFIAQPPTTILINTTTNPSATFRNYGIAQETFDVYFEIEESGVPVYSDNATLTLNPASGSTFVFTTPWTSGPTQGIVYDVTAYTVLVGDMFTSNDTLTRQTVTALVSDWIRCADRPAPALCHATCYDPVDDYIYAFGGGDGFIYFNYNYRYDPNTDSWASMTALPVAINWIDASVCEWNRSIYIFGGFDGITHNYNYIYDIAGNSWSSGTNMPIGRMAGGQVIYNDSLIYMLGGYDGVGPSTNVQIYNTYTDAWTVGTALPAANMMEGVAIHSDTIWLVGGYDGALAYSNLYYGVINPLNCETITWSVGDPLSVPNFNNGATQMVRVNSYLYMVGGFENAATITNAAWEYNVGSGTWTALPDYPMTITRNDFLVARDGVIDTFEIYVCGGDNSGGWTSTNQVWKLKWAGPSALDVGTAAITSPPGGKVTPADYDVIGRIHNFGTSSATFDVTANVYDTTNAWNLEFTQTITLTNFASGDDTLHNFGTVTFAFDKVFYTEIYTELVGDEDTGNDTASVYTSTQLVLGDIIYEKEIETPCGDNHLLGVEYDGTYFYVTGGNSGVDPNKVYVLDTLGTLIWTFDQPAWSTGWGWRDLAWDNAYAGADRVDTLYGSVDGNVDKFGIDLLGGSLTNYGSYAGPELPNRALAWMDDNLWFYTANFASPCYWFNKSGPLGSAANAWTMYGAAYDTDASDGGWIWWHSQDDPGTGWLGQIEQYDPSTQTFTGFNFGYQPTVTIPAAAGGLSFYEGFRNCDVLFALVQGTPDAIVGIYVRQDQPPLANDVGTQAINNPGTTILINETINPSATFKNYGAMAAFFSVFFEIEESGVPVYTNSQIINLNPAENTTVVFPATWTSGPIPGIVYDVTVYTVLVGDMDTSNDTLIQQTITTNLTDWIRCADRPAPALCHATCYDPVDDYIYAFGGGDGFIYFNYNYRYDPNTDSWASMTVLPVAMNWIDASVCEWSREIFIFGGFTGSVNNYNYIYDITGDSWSTGASLPIARTCAGQVIYNDSLIYMLGGYDGAGSSDNVQIYNTYTDFWTNGTNLPILFRMGGVSILGDTIWIIGGSDGTFPNTNLYYGVIDPLNCENITWSTGDALPDDSLLCNGATPMVRAGNSYLYVVGGFTGAFISSITNHAWEYGFAKGTWTALPNYPMNITRNDFLVARDGGTYPEIYVGGGDNSGSWTMTSQVWKLRWAAPVAIELSFFTADYKNGEVILQWKTECEEDNALWMIDRKEDKGDWETVTTIPSEGNSPSGYFYEYSDKGVLENRRYTYRLGDIDTEGNLTWRMTIVVFTHDQFAPKVFGLAQNYPNPFVNQTFLKYQVPRKEKVTITVYDVAGREVTKLTDCIHDPGFYLIAWDGYGKNGEKTGNGVYFCRMEAAAFTRTRRLIRF